MPTHERDIATVFPLVIIIIISRNI